ncbi:family 10 glycosylhydrolase [Candidatus Soleaferrea massiliensis]|uniref:family 10 glycosylhydrolase n=1 Tax=Candidatus Soleaferrea massiliensis TaxID=1470354 RepID=UPI0018CDDC8B|nr:family 10 glycosylhydrolase [Candidatus Soleaferrea massiliensis]
MIILKKPMRLAVSVVLLLSILLGVLPAGAFAADAVFENPITPYAAAANMPKELDVAYIKIGTTVSEYEASLELEEGQSVVVKRGGNGLDREDPIGTGNIISVMKDGKEAYRNQALVRGDMDGDGIMGIRDLLMVKMVILNGGPEDIYEWMGDFEEDGNIGIRDLISMKIYILTAGETVPVESVSFENEEESLFVGESVTLRPIIQPEYASNRSVVYSIGNSSVASITQDGVVTAKRAGNTWATVRTVDGSKTAKCLIRVQEKSPQQEEVRAVWLSYIDLTTIMKNKSKAEFTAAVNRYFDNAAQYGFNDVIVQVRPFGDAIYPSRYFPYSHILSGTQGKNPGYDPLAIMVQLAHEKNLRIEAWINPYRVQIGSADASKLADSNPAKAWYAQKNGCVVQSGSGLYYNPAKKEVQELVINGVREIVQNYQVDGIHFDDYFYPTTDAAFDQTEYQAYKNGGGKLGLADWRRSNVDQLVSGVYQAIKKIDSTVLFGISPQGNMQNNYNTQFIDVEKWVTTPGYIDYICPQMYFGFQNSACPFSETVKKWNDMITLDNVKLYVGLAAYKIGKEDTYAGAGKFEWISATDMLKRQVVDARRNEHYSGFSVFRYDFFFNIPQDSNKSQIQKEMENLKSVLN